MNKSERLTLLISTFAIIISIVSLYFQFFYKTQEIRLSIIDTEVDLTKQEIETKLVYHNSGNLYTTITQNFLIFYQNKEHINNSIMFSNELENVTRTETYDPIVLTPGEQKLKSLITKLFFNRVNFDKYKINPQDKINVALNIGFLDSNGMKTNEFVELGWIKLDMERNIREFHFDFTNKILEGYGYTSGIDIEVTSSVETQVN